MRADRAADAGRRGGVAGAVAIADAGGGAVAADKTYATASSVTYDAVYVPGGAASAAALRAMGDARAFVSEAYKHGKPVAASGDGVALVQASEIGALAAQGVLLADGAADRAFAEQFVAAIARHRFRDRARLGQVAA